MTDPLRVSFALCFASCVVACSPPPPSSPTPVPTDDAAPSASAVAPGPIGAGPSASVAAPAESAPPVMCTKMACMDGLEIELRPQVPRPGHYEVTVTAGSEKATCKIEFPYPACGKPATQCEGTLPMMAIESGCELPKAQQTFPKLRVGEAPQRLSLTVRRDGKDRSEGLSPDLVPVYSEARPNGPSCPPVCQSGHLVGSWREKGDPPPK